MSKLPPSLATSQHKRIERLHFPQNGDSNMFFKCGRKHFKDRYNYSSPFISQSHHMVRNHNDKRYEEMRSSQQEQSRGLLDKLYQAVNHNSTQNSRCRAHDDRSKQAQESREALDQQVYNFNLSKAYNPSVNFRNYREVNTSFSPSQTKEGKKDNLNDLQRSRMKTQMQSKPVFLMKQEPFCKKRVRTESCEPGTIKSYQKPPRFNPTYLSSINY